MIEAPYSKRGHPALQISRLLLRLMTAIYARSAVKLKVQTEHYLEVHG